MEVPETIKRSRFRTVLLLSLGYLHCLYGSSASSFSLAGSCPTPPHACRQLNDPQKFRYTGNKSKTSRVLYHACLCSNNYVHHNWKRLLLSVLLSLDHSYDCYYCGYYYHQERLFLLLYCFCPRCFWNSLHPLRAITRTVIWSPLYLIVSPLYHHFWLTGTPLLLIHFIDTPWNLSMF